MYSTQEVADMLRVSKDTLLRWLRQGKIPEPARDHHGFRVFVRRDLALIWQYVDDRQRRVMANKLRRRARRR